MIPAKKQRVGEAGTSFSQDDILCGSVDVQCDLCTGKEKSKADKYCLDCTVWYCNVHFKENHEDQKHSLVEGDDQLGLQDRICTQHKKPLVMFCHTDQKCVCILCKTDKHKGHDMVPSSPARQKKQVRLIILLPTWRLSNGNLNVEAQIV